MASIQALFAIKIYHKNHVIERKRHKVIATFYLKKNNKIKKQLKY